MGDHLYFMTEGLVKIVTKNEEGEIVNQFYFKKNSFFGEIALLT